MLRDKLSRFSQHIDSPDKLNNDDAEYDRYRVAHKLLGGQLCNLPAGTFLKITSDFSSDYKHGNLSIFQLTQFAPCRYLHFNRCGTDDAIDPEKLLFLDIETTGLGGSGTVPFLIGLGSILGDSFQVRQYFLPDYPDEAAMLEAVREEISGETVIVSYNGKAFDMPIITDRMIINRVERNLGIADHIDLLHSTRRLYRRRLQSCTLSNIERHILDYHRHGDIPGELVPAVYFAWLNTMETELLKPVVEHNLNDIVSLYFLMYQISRIHSEPEKQLTDADDLYSLARIFENRKEHDRVRLTLEGCRNIISDEGRYDLLYMQSLACKRTGCFDEAVALWKQVAESEDILTFPALIELAKYYEHRVRDLPLALEYSQKAQRVCPARESDRANLIKRIARLNKKMAR